MRSPCLTLLATLLLVSLVACSGSSKTPANTATVAPAATIAAAAPVTAAVATATTATVPATASATAQPATPAPLPANDEEVTFLSGGDTIYGSVMLPARAAVQRLPAVLIISGSGPSDRNGNGRTADAQVGTNLNFARALAGMGVASLRYDKLASGRTGLTGHPDPSQIDFQTFIDEARDAYRYLRGRPDVDPSRTYILGHSEGGMIALVLGGQLAADAPRGLILAAPPGIPILETIRRQKGDQVNAAVQAGQESRLRADAELAEADRVISSLKTTGKLPPSIADPWLRAVFTPVNTRVLVDEERYDPAALAKALPKTMPVLVLHGSKDSQISDDDIQTLMRAFAAAGIEKAADKELPDNNHVFKEVPGTPNPIVDYTNPALRFSTGAVAAIADFLTANR